MERANYLLTEARIAIKANLVLWSNGRADDTFVDNAALASDTNDSGEDSKDDSTDNSESDPFNYRLIKMDSVAEQLAKLYPRCTWAEDYLKSLEHGEFNIQFTPAIHIESNNVSGIKFGSRSAPKAKIAKDISHNRGGNKI